MREKMEKETIYKRIGWQGLLNTVWNSTPYRSKLLALPYGLWIYGVFMKKSSSLGELLQLHSNKYMDSKIFKLFRPRYSKVKMILETYGVTT